MSKIWELSLVEPGVSKFSFSLEETIYATSLFLRNGKGEVLAEVPLDRIANAGETAKKLAEEVLKLFVAQRATYEGILADLQEDSKAVEMGKNAAYCSVLSDLRAYKREIEVRRLNAIQQYAKSYPDAGIDIGTLRSDSTLESTNAVDKIIKELQRRTSNIAQKDRAALTLDQLRARCHHYREALEQIADMESLPLAKQHAAKTLKDESKF